MSTHITIVKKSSGHNLQVTGGSPEQGGGILILHEVDKPKIDYAAK